MGIRAIAEPTSAVAVVLVLVIWPLAMVLGAAWNEPSRAEPGLTAMDQQAALGIHTVLLVLSTLAIAVPVGSATALAVFRTDLPGRRCLGLLCMLPALVPLDLHATAWLAALGPQGLGASLGLPLEVKGLCGAAWVHAMASVPWVVVLVGAAVRTVEPELEEDCLLAAGPLRTMWHVTLRRSAGAIVAAALVVTVLTAGEIAVTDLLQVRTYAETVYTEFAVVGRVGAATRTAVPGLGVFGALVLVAGWLVTRWVHQDYQAIFMSRVVFRLGALRWAAAIGSGLVVAVTLGVPAASLAWRAGLVFSRPAAEAATAQSTAMVAIRAHNSSEAPGPRWSPVALASNFIGSVRVAGRELGYSLGLAAAACGLTVPWAWWLALSARETSWGRVLASVTASVLLALPGPVVGVGISLALSRPTRWWQGDPIASHAAEWLAGVADSPAVLVWLLALRTLPFVLLVLWPVVRLVNRSMLDAARLDGAGSWTRFWHVELPACWPAAAAAAMVCAVLGLGELSGSIIVAPPGPQPLSVRIFTLAHNGVDNYLAGICLVLLVVATAGTALALASLRWVARSLNE